ncbi:oxidoreductase [Silvibacterium dinghuense]|uniref:Oxidoreductase n=1 Tax=Silvibacterium dinghuense TaxID=1560006 RepID=A0A4V1NW00_9BACT|nr:oxidoreductase [Silvibacterium dinghuense]RXS97692.1 oxidoreductase [Silvibacterium dinghuense]GGH01212.1 putative oxidoreductase YdbC [Silvibacterium dinghuense]
MTDSTKLGGTFTLPGTNITLHRMGYGAMQLAGSEPGKLVWGPPRDRAAALAVLREAVAAGVNHIDTSDFYGPYVVNKILREALHPYPAGLTLVTKIGFLRGEDGSWYPAQSAAELTAAVESNLRNLGLDQSTGALDVVNLRLGAAHGPNEDSLEAPLTALAELQQKGLVRHIGLSTVSEKQYEEARAIAPIVCIQNLYNVAHREDDAFVDRLAKDGVAYVPYFPLGGFTPLQAGELNEVAASLGATPMQVALAWLLHRSPNILLIPGTSSVGHLRENLAAASLALPAEALEKLDEIGAVKQ